MSDRALGYAFGVGTGLCLAPALRVLIGSWAALIGAAIVIGCMVTITRRIS